MVVCAHGNVNEFCKEYDMLIVETHVGDIEKYSGIFRVLVTDQEMTEYNYYYLKGRMLAKGYELVSVHHSDKRCLVDLIAHTVEKELEDKREKFGGRHMFGTNEDGLTEHGRTVVRRILELRDTGFSLRQIKECPDVHHPDGKSLSISTIQVIIKNREIYEKKGL